MDKIKRSLQPVRLTSSVCQAVIIACGWKQSDLFLVGLISKVGKTGELPMLSLPWHQSTCCVNALAPGKTRAGGLLLTAMPPLRLCMRRGPRHGRSGAWGAGTRPCRDGNGTFLAAQARHEQCWVSAGMGNRPLPLGMGTWCLSPVGVPVSQCLPIPV